MAKKLVTKKLGLAQRRKLLNVIADFIEPLPKNKFNMDFFGVSRGEFNPAGFWITQGPTMHNCGTAGCALGWACSIPAIAGIGLTPAKVDEDAWLYAAVYLGMRYVEAETLFGLARRGHKTPTEVASNIRYFAKTGKMPLALRKAFAAEERYYTEDREVGHYDDHSAYPWVV